MILELVGGVILVAPLLMLAGWLLWRSGGPRPADKPKDGREEPEPRHRPVVPAGVPVRPMVRGPELSPLWSIARALVTVLSVVLFVCPGVPSLFFGYLGVSGQLSDTSDRENLGLGLVLLVLGLLAVTPGVLCLFLWKQPRGSGPGAGGG
jgi:hypothetical protein